MQKKQRVAIVTFLALLVTYASAKPANRLTLDTNDTITVDKTELIEALRNVAISEIKKHQQHKHYVDKQGRYNTYLPTQQGQTIPVYNSVSKRVEYIPVYLPTYKDKDTYQPQYIVNTANDEAIKQLQKQIEQLQKQITTINKTVTDSVVRLQIDSLANIVNSFRTQRDTIVLKTTKAESTPKTLVETNTQKTLTDADTTTVLPNNIVTFDTQLRQVFFPVSSAQLSYEAKTTLLFVAKLLKSNREMKVELTGFASKEGNKTFNIKLAMKRINSVRQFLCFHGVHTQQISTIAYGIDKYADMPSYARRVELCISL